MNPVAWIFAEAWKPILPISFLDKLQKFTDTTVPARHKSNEKVLADGLNWTEKSFLIAYLSWIDAYSKDVWWNFR